MKQALINRFEIFRLPLSIVDRGRLFFWSCWWPVAKKLGLVVPSFSVQLFGRSVFVADGTDLGTFLEIFLFKEYEADIDANRIKNILDLGANSGYTAIYLANKFPQATIVAVEADPANVSKIKKNTSRMENIKVASVAVAKETGTIDFYLNFKTSISGSTIARDPQAQKISVPAVTLSDLEKEYGPFDMVKFDIEGAEWEAILPNILVKSPYLWIGEYHTDLTGHSEQEFVSRFNGYKTISRPIAKKRSLLNYTLVS